MTDQSVAVSAVAAASPAGVKAAAATATAVVGYGNEEKMGKRDRRSGGRGRHGTLTAHKISITLRTMYCGNET